MFISEKGIERLDTSEGHLFEKPGGGSSAIYGPDGVQLTKDMDECTEGVGGSIRARVYEPRRLERE